MHSLHSLSPVVRERGAKERVGTQITRYDILEDPSFVIRRALELWVAGEFDPARMDER